MTVTLLHGDCRDVLPALPAGSVQCVVTSPPYWGLRDYGVVNQIGLEESVDDYVTALVAVFREVRRVLVDDGVLWLNLGDRYAAPSTWGGASGAKNAYSAAGGYPRSRRVSVHSGLKDKDLIGVPWLVAFALRADGWYLRADCIWHKPNGMPESVTDRPTRVHEYVFLLSKSARYYYDAAAVAEPAAASSRERARLGRRPLSARQQAMHEAGIHGASESLRVYDRDTRNRRSVWTVPTQPYGGPHFASFPEALAEICILAGCPAQLCDVCGRPWMRVYEATGHINQRERAHAPRNASTKPDSTGWEPVRRATHVEPTCTCNATTRPGVVLDPFAGSGTTLRVAERLGRDAIGIELNPEYISLQEQRVNGVQREMVEVRYVP